MSAKRWVEGLSMSRKLYVLSSLARPGRYRATERAVHCAGSESEDR